MSLIGDFCNCNELILCSKGNSAFAEAAIIPASFIIAFECVQVQSQKSIIILEIFQINWVWDTSLKVMTVWLTGLDYICIACSWHIIKLFCSWVKTCFHGQQEIILLFSDRFDLQEFRIIQSFYSFLNLSTVCAQWLS